MDYLAISALRSYERRAQLRDFHLRALSAREGNTAMTSVIADPSIPVLEKCAAVTRIHLAKELPNIEHVRRMIF